MKLELKKFDPTKIKNDSVVVFIGKRNTGKSYCMKDIMSYNRDIPVGVVVSPTERANGYFEKFIPKMLIYDDLDEKLVSKFLNRQINITKDKKRDLEKHGSSTIDPRAFLILDDCMYNKAVTKDKNIRCIFMNGSGDDLSSKLSDSGLYFLSLTGISFLSWAFTKFISQFPAFLAISTPFEKRLASFTELNVLKFCILFIYRFY